MAKPCCFKASSKTLYLQHSGFCLIHHHHQLISFTCFLHHQFIIFTEAMSRQLILFTCFLLLVSSTQAIGVKYCDKKKNYAVTIQQVKIIPDPVVPGKAATFKISAVTGQAISGGKVVIYVAYFGLPVHQETHEVCEEVSCPIATGNFVLSHTQTLPSFTPPGSYTLKMTMEDKNNQELTCFSFNFKIGFGSLVAES